MSREEPQVFTRWIDPTIEQLQQRIDKAIEYIKSQQVIFKDYDIVVDNQLKNILEILGYKGDIK